MTSRAQNLLMILGLVLVAGLGYYVYSQRAALSLNTGTVDNELAVTTNEFVQRLAELSNIKYDTTIFSDPRFRSLVDFSEPINPQPVGSPNPFTGN